MKNYANLTYRELKTLVPEAPRGRMTVKKLEGKEVLFTEKVDDATITIYLNGFLVYTKPDSHGHPHNTVYSVHRCKQIIFPVTFSKEEREGAWDMSGLADAVTYRMIDGRMTKFHIVREEHYLDSPWWLPITAICEERMRHNENSREEYKCEFSVDGSSENEEGEQSCENWNPELGYDPFKEKEEAEEKAEKDKENHERLQAALKTLTDIQLRTVNLFYSNPGVRQKDLAKEMGVDQSTFNRNLQGALTKLRKNF